MRFPRMLITATALLLATYAAYGLPPDRGVNAVNPAANAAEAMQDCMAACTPHCTNPAICTNRCQTVVHQIGLPPPSAFQGLPADAATCAVLEAGAWAWYGTCTFLLNKATGAFSQVAGQATFLTSVSSVLGGSTNSVVNQALKVADPCGYIRDQMIQQNMTLQHCPQSTILPALGINPSILPGIKK